MQLSKPASNCQGQGVSYDFIIDSADKAKPISISFDYNFTGAASSGAVGSDSDVQVYVYDITNAIFIPVSPKVLTTAGTTNGTFKGTFQTAINSTSYRLIMHVATTSATAWAFTFDNVVVGPQPVALGVPVTDWAAYTPTITSVGTATNVSFFWRRVGQNLEVKGWFVAGTVTAAFATISLPSGLSMDAAALGTNNTLGNPGALVGRLQCGANSGYQASVVVAPATSTTIVYLNSVASTATLTPNASNVNTFILTSSSNAVDFILPITGWSSNVSMSQDTDTRIVAGMFYGSATCTANTAIIFPTIQKDTHGAYNTSTGQYIAPVAGFYHVNMTTNGSATIAALHVYIGGVQQNPVLGYQIGSQGTGTGSGIYFANVGQAIDVRAGQTITSFSGSYSIHRLTGPSAIAATESVNARYFASATALSGSLATINWTTKDFDSHLGMVSGTYTVPTSGKYQVQSSLAVAGTFALNNAVNMQLQKNGTAVSEDNAIAGGATTSMNVNCSDVINCLAGDTIRVQVSTTATGPSIQSSNSKNFFSIARVGN